MSGLKDLVCKYSGDGDFLQWCKRLELVCKLKKEAELHSILPLFLDGPAFAVYTQLDDLQTDDYDFVKGELAKAFCASPFTAYEQLVARRLGVGESPDVYMADLRRLYQLTGYPEAPVDLLRCAFVAGLPTDVKVQMMAMDGVTTMTMGELVAKTRAVLSSSRVMQQEGPVVCASTGGFGARGRGRGRGAVTCYQCGQAGHISRVCTRGMRCFSCQGIGHMAKDCPSTTTRKQGNDGGAVSSVPVASPPAQ